MDKERLKSILIDLLENDEDVQYYIQQAVENQNRRDEWAEAHAWT
jgi:hypothetical protein